MKASLKMVLSVFIVLFVMGNFAVAEKAPGQPDSTRLSPDQIVENLIYKFPEEDGWKSEIKHSDGKRDLEYFYPKGSSSSGWKEMASIEFVAGFGRGDVAGQGRAVYLGTKRGCPDATWDILHMALDHERQYKYIIFEIKCPKFENGLEGQVQLWKMIGGRTGTFVLQYSYNGVEMPEGRRDEIISFLQDAYLETQKKETSTE